MEEKKTINITKTEETGANSHQYGDGSDLGLTHYLGNDENRPREGKNINEKSGKKIGQEALGNVDSDTHS